MAQEDSIYILSSKEEARKRIDFRSRQRKSEPGV